MTTPEFAEPRGLQQAFSYPRSAFEATTELTLFLQNHIKKSGPLTFRDFMAQALYHPVHGYYARPDSDNISKKGDFITSVSVGATFGKILAHRLHAFWLANQSPRPFHLLELGAHNGNLARDILAELQNTFPHLAQITQYHICEPLPQQFQFLSNQLGPQIHLISSPTQLQVPFGALIANEVLDALPVPLFLHTQNQWHEVTVTAHQNRLHWDLKKSPFTLPGTFPDPYLTEGSPDFSTFLAPLKSVFESGLFLFIDYGLDQDSLYHPARTAGTLRAYRNHQSNAHPLDFPGQQDLTADVNFTAFENAAADLGFLVHPALSQSRYLTYAAKNWLFSSPPAQEIRQFQTLTHPSQFGTRFHALELTTGSAQRAFPF